MTPKNHSVTPTRNLTQLLATLQEFSQELCAVFCSVKLEPLYSSRNEETE